MKKTIKEIAETCDVLISTSTNLSFFLQYDDDTDTYNLEDDEGLIHESDLSPSLEVSVDQGDKHTYVGFNSAWYYAYQYTQVRF